MDTRHTHTRHGLRGSGRWLIVLVGMAILTGAPGAVRGEDQEASQPIVCPICSHVRDGTASYPTKAGTLLIRGAANTLLGWTEVIRRPAQEAKAGGNVLVGIGKGIGEGFRRTFAGVGELLTFWTPTTQQSYVHFAEDCPICMGRPVPKD